MITLNEYLKNHLTHEETNNFIANTKRFRMFFNRNKNRSAYYSLRCAFDFNNAPEGKSYWNDKLKRINDVVFTYHPNGKINSIIPIINGEIHKYCYFLDQNEQLQKIIKHSDNSCIVIFEKKLYI
jgi:antitoxin component YwqK of YwqJK toxin-antitoxin module